MSNLCLAHARRPFWWPSWKSAKCCDFNIFYLINFKICICSMNNNTSLSMSNLCLAHARRPFWWPSWKSAKCCDFNIFYLINFKICIHALWTTTHQSVCQICVSHMRGGHFGGHLGNLQNAVICRYTFFFLFFLLSSFFVFLFMQLNIRKLNIEQYQIIWFIAFILLPHQSN